MPSNSFAVFSNKQNSGGVSGGVPTEESSLNSVTPSLQQRHDKFAGYRLGLWNQRESQVRIQSLNELRQSVSETCELPVLVLFLQAELDVAGIGEGMVHPVYRRRVMIAASILGATLERSGGKRRVLGLLPETRVANANLAVEQQLLPRDALGGALRVG
jgi:hypothetical protein